MKEVYYNPSHPSSFSSSRKLYAAVRKRYKNITKPEIRQWLQKQETYGLTRPVRHNFPRNRVIVNGIDVQWDGDLIDMVNLTKFNDQYKYILLMIDIFSRYVWLEPLKTKKGGEVAQAMKKVFDQGRQPVRLRTDKGTEFTNQQVRRFLASVNVHTFVTHNEPKANYAERAIKTIKTKLTRYMMHRQTNRYIDILQQVASSYNSSKHSSLGRAPAQVNTANEDQVRLDQYKIRQKRQRTPHKRRLKYKIGDTVRISHIRAIFDREYHQKWTGEVFKITARYIREGIPVYKLVDWSGEEVRGTFYDEELQPVIIDEETEYRIEKVLRKRTRQGRKEILVRWLHWPPKYDSYILESEAHRFLIP